ncbi:hypothetical protein [Vibrio crassostreae]|uniref:hypothetical protein n=1 Tax=Vibrio crassostreae TaxID=246167 RepID=UPI001B30B32D|nr:hypothetical protein [Vibrio crassostreae]
MPKAHYTAAELKVDKRGSAYGNGKAELVPVPNVELYGLHKTNLEAKKAIVLIFMPELDGSTDEHIKGVSKEFFTGTHKTFKVVKVTK